MGILKYIFLTSTQMKYCIILLLLAVAAVNTSQRRLGTPVDALKAAAKKVGDYAKTRAPTFLTCMKGVAADVLPAALTSAMNMVAPLLGGRRLFGLSSITNVAKAAAKKVFCAGVSPLVNAAKPKMVAMLKSKLPANVTSAAAWPKAQVCVDTEVTAMIAFGKKEVGCRRRLALNPMAELKKAAAKVGTYAKTRAPTFLTCMKGVAADVLPAPLVSAMNMAAALLGGRRLFGLSSITNVAKAAAKKLFCAGVTPLVNAAKPKMVAMLKSKLPANVTSAAAWPKAQVCVDTEVTALVAYVKKEVGC